ncbi:PLP-dependent transferase [bacterium]|nr:PLP-dependent transferase [bacterium]
MKKRESHFETRCIHGGQEPDPQTGAVMPPVSLSSTYAQSAPAKPVGDYEYSRTNNPTRHALESALANLEGGVGAVAFASGMAAVDGVMRLLKPGQTLVSGRDLYGGTARLFRSDVLPTREWLSVDTTEPDRFEGWKKANLIWVETPTNPLLEVTDIAQIRALAPQAILAVDNTFMSPALQNPLSLGADLVVHSTTKYIGGHSDVVGGCVIAKERVLCERLQSIQNDAGAIPGPLDCYLQLRGIKTLALRMERHLKSAGKIARFLEKHPLVEEVIWPGHPSHPQHEVQRRQARGGGGIISFRVKEGCSAPQAVSQMTFWTLAESLGGVESLVCLPSKMTHASIPERERENRGITDELIRLSVGIEDCDDLIRGIERGLQKATS